MNELYAASQHIIALVCLLLTTVCLIISVKGKTRADLFFVLTGVIVMLFFVLLSRGLVAANNTAAPFVAFIKQFVFAGYVGYSVWYLLGIVTLNTKKILICALLFVACCIGAMYARNGYSLTILWGFVALIAISAFSILGMRVLVLRSLKIFKSARLQFFAAILCTCQLLFFMTALLYMAGLSRMYDGTSKLTLSVLALIFILSVVALLVAALIEKSNVSIAFEVNKQRLESIMQNAPLMVLETNVYGDIIYINDFGAKLLGYGSADQVVTLNWFDSFLSPSEVSACRKLYAEIFNGKLAATMFRNTVKCKTDEEVVISCVGFVSHQLKGHAQSVITVCRDTSEEESVNRLVTQLQKELEKENIPMTQDASFELEENVVGKSKSFMYALQRARQVSITHAPVLLEGETGVGKEVFANLIHKNSSRSEMAFIKVNCGALPKELIEDELFGHEKGAFTSAIQSRKGRFELADGGTIFLDEIGELPLDMQPKLLRVLQNGEFERVGGQKTIRVDVRILAATNRNLLAEISNGNFREDLYYRLNVFPITIPQLRNRKEDLPDLINYFIASKCKEYNKALEQISAFDLQRLVDYRWPGNIRELKNVIERAVIVSEGHVLKLNWWMENEPAKESAVNQTLERIEHDHIITVMDKCRWRINGENGAAQILNMHPNTLRSKMKRLGIIRPQLMPAADFAGDAHFFSHE